MTDRRGFIAALEAELPAALRKLQQGQVAPVDLPQAAIGPGMAVFSRYGGVLEPDGKKMTVRSALAQSTRSSTRYSTSRRATSTPPRGSRWRGTANTATRWAGSATPTTSPGPATRASTCSIATAS